MQYFTSLYFKQGNSIEFMLYSFQDDSGPSLVYIPVKKNKCYVDSGEYEDGEVWEQLKSYESRCYCDKGTEKCYAA